MLFGKFRKVGILYVYPAFNFSEHKEPVIYDDRRMASGSPYALSISSKNRRLFDDTRAEPQLWQWFLMLQHPYFLYIKTGYICSNPRFLAFSTSIYVMRLRHHFVEGDAVSAKKKMVCNFKKRIPTRMSGDLCCIFNCLVPMKL